RGEDAAAPRGGIELRLVDLEAFADDLLDRQARRERRQRVLEHDLDLAAQAALLAFAGLGPALAVDADVALRIDQAEHRERERGLARARFADDAERLARREIEAHVLHGGEAAALEPAAHARQMRRIVHVDLARFDQGAARRRRDIA